jgi:hypothetical protein
VAEETLVESNALSEGPAEELTASDAELVPDQPGGPIFRMSIGIVQRAYAVVLELKDEEPSRQLRFFGEKRVMSKVEVLAEFDRVVREWGGALGLVELDPRFPGE